MAKHIDLDRTELVEVQGNGLILEVSKGDEGQLLVRVESEEGNRRIGIKPHDEDARVIVFTLGPSLEGPNLSLVK